MSDTDERFADVAEHGGIAGFEPEFVDVSGIRTRYYDLGDGEPLVLLHGGGWSGYSNANTWSTVLDRLRREFRVIAFDRVGCGMTDNPEDVEAYRYRTEVDHALEFLETMGIERSHVCGASRGAGLGARLAVEAPDRFETLIMTNSHTFGPPAGDRAHRGDRLFERFAPSFEATDPEYTRFRYEQFCHQTDHITDEFCAANAYMSSTPKARETAAVMESREERFAETLDEQMNEAHDRIRDGVLTIPTLYAFGRNDITVPLETATAAFDLIGQENPNVRLQLFNDCGHLPYREYPGEFSRTVVDFTDRWH